MNNTTENLKRVLKEYEYFLIPVLNPLDKENFKILFDSKKEFKHIKKLFSKVYLNKCEEYNLLNFSYDERFIYITL